MIDRQRDINDFTKEVECEYDGRRFRVRDNGAVYRYLQEGGRPSPLDCAWTFGKEDYRTHFMKIGEHKVHQIVAEAFQLPNKRPHCIIDHIDDNKENNAISNLRWITPAMKALEDPQIKQKIIAACGSVEEFLDNPALLYGHEYMDKNFCWMRKLTRVQVRGLESSKKSSADEPVTISIDKRTEASDKSGKEYCKKRESNNDPWIFNLEQPIAYGLPLGTNYTGDPFEHIKRKYLQPKVKYIDISTPSLTSNAVQVDWKLPTEFPCCPQGVIDNPLQVYKQNLKGGAVFCKNKYYSSTVVDSAFAVKGTLLVMTTNPDSIKPWALTKITYENGRFVHINGGTYFEEDGAKKYFTLEQGKEWTGDEDLLDECCN